MYHAIRFLIPVGLAFSVLAGASLSVGAQEPSGLQAAAAIEQAMITAIAGAEKSVVSIARVSSDGSAVRGRGNLDARFAIRPGGVPEIQEGPGDPRDPAFVPKEFATGVVIDGKGLILTNYHCVQKNDIHLITTIGRKVFQCTGVYAADPRSDLAVLKVDNNDPKRPLLPDDLTPIKFGDAKTLRKGQIVITLGNPYGIARDGQVSASWGIVSNLARKLGPKPRDEEPTLHQFGTLIQTDARLNWGTSGGALVNLKGEMVGLTTSLAATTNYEQAAGYAIPIDDTFRRVVNTLKEGRAVEYGFLGVSPNAVIHPEESQGRHGLVIGHVTQGGPASRSGLIGGETITHINGQPIYDFDDLRLLVGRIPAGSTTTITFERGTGTHVVDVVLSKYRKTSGLKAREAIYPVRDPQWRGLRVDFATAVVDLRAVNDYLPAKVAVSEVEQDSPAFRAGLRTGMFVANVGNTPIDSPEDFRREVARLKGPVTLQTIGDYHVPRLLKVAEE